MKYLLTLLMLLIVAPSAAQTTLPAVGARVRVTFADDDTAPVVGVVTATTSDTLHLQPEQAIPLAAVQLLEVSRGRRSHAGRGAATGAVVGGVSMAAVGVFLHGFDVSFQEDHSEPSLLASVSYAVLGGVAGAAAGGLVGYGIGSQFHSERWEVIALPSASVYGGSGIGLHLTVRLL